MEVDCIVKPHYNEDALDMKISLYLIFTIIYSLHVDIGEKHVIFVISCLLYIIFSTWNRRWFHFEGMQHFLWNSAVHSWCTSLADAFFAVWLTKKQIYGEMPSISLWQHSLAVLSTADSVGCTNAFLVLCLTNKWSGHIWKICFRDALFD